MRAALTLVATGALTAVALAAPVPDDMPLCPPRGSPPGPLCMTIDDASHRPSDPLASAQLDRDANGGDDDKSPRTKTVCHSYPNHILCEAVPVTDTDTHFDTDLDTAISAQLDKDANGGDDKTPPTKVVCHSYPNQILCENVPITAINLDAVVSKQHDKRADDDDDDDDDDDNDPPTKLVCHSYPNQFVCESVPITAINFDAVVSKQHDKRAGADADDDKSPPTKVVCHSYPNQILCESVPITAINFDTVASAQLEKSIDPDADDKSVPTEIVCHHFPNNRTLCADVPITAINTHPRPRPIPSTSTSLRWHPDPDHYPIRTSEIDGMAVAERDLPSPPDMTAPGRPAPDVIVEPLDSPAPGSVPEEKGKTERRQLVVPQAAATEGDDAPVWVHVYDGPRPRIERPFVVDN